MISRPLSHCINSLKWFIPAIVLLGTAPTQVFVWFIWKILSIFLPGSVFTNGEEQLWSAYQFLVLFFYEHYSGIKLHFYEDAKEIFKKRENVLFMMNHQSALDWTVVDMLACRQGSMGYIRYILKYGLRFFPLYGPYFYQHLCLYVKRRGNFDESNAVNTLQQIRKQNVRFWMVLFPEGTRYNPDNRAVIERSKQFAKDQGLKVLEHHLTPRVKAAWLCVDQLGDKLDAVYDVTTVYGNCYDPILKKRSVPPSLTDFFDGSMQEIHISVKRIDRCEIPRELSEFKLWMHNRFITKDKLLQRCFSDDPTLTNSLGDVSYSYPLSFKLTFSVFLCYFIVNMPMYCTELGRQLLLFFALGGTILGWIWMKIAP